MNYVFICRYNREKEKHLTCNFKETLVHGFLENKCPSFIKSFKEASKTMVVQKLFYIM